MKDITEEEKKCWTTTVSGKVFYPFSPNPDSIDIFDIGHALSNICRFNGHVSSFYSVAEHSVRVSNLVPKEFKLWALLHDASEAYICDLAGPIKKIKRMEFYCSLEDLILEAIINKYNLIGNQVPDIVKAADQHMLMLEKRDLIPHSQNQKWDNDFEVYDNTIIPLSPKNAEEYYISTFLNVSRDK